tara:strand:- start:103 stop:540 length:438 start_codon:yes stop_codon:yes gene_type:complete
MRFRENGGRFRSHDEYLDHIEQSVPASYAGREDEYRELVHRNHEMGIPKMTTYLACEDCLDQYAFIGGGIIVSLVREGDTIASTIQSQFSTDGKLSNFLTYQDGARLLGRLITDRVDAEERDAILGGRPRIGTDVLDRPVFLSAA